MLRYVRPTVLTPELLGTRIFSPFAYRLIRDIDVVPIGLDEATRLAAWFPIAWRVVDGTHQLVAVRSLLQDGLGAPYDVARNLHALPLVCLAYPLLFAGGEVPDRAQARWLDRNVADLPTDNGATIMSPDGKPTRGTVMRLRALDALSEMLAVTEAVARRLAARDLFEPWCLEFEVGGRMIGHRGLWIVKQSAFAGPALQPLLAEFGVPLARFLSAHRMSLFRAGGLLFMARTALSDRMVSARADARDAGARGAR